MKQTTPRNVAGMNVGSATLVMVFAVICLTIFAVMSMMTAGNALTLSEKSAQAVTEYYEAECVAIEIYEELSANYDGTFVLPMEYSAQTEFADGRDCLSYWVDIDDSQQLWVQLYDQNGTLQVARWQVEDNGMWIADLNLNLWLG